MERASTVGALSNYSLSNQSQYCLALWCISHSLIKGQNVKEVPFIKKRLMHERA